MLIRTSAMAKASLVLWIIAAAVSVHAAVTVKTSLDRDVVMTGETASLSISIEGGNPERADNFPAIKGIAIQYQGLSQNVTIVNGVSSSKRVLTFAVTASQPGQYTIPAINVVVDGSPYPTEPVKLTVTKSDASAQQNRYAFMRLNVAKKEIYVGEVFPVELQLYLTQARDVQAPQLKSDGFVIHKQLENTKSQTQIGNIIYTVLSFRMSVSAAKAGDLNLGPAESSLTLLLRSQQDPNDAFGFFPRYQQRAITVSSPAVPMHVLPLPTREVPPGFSGAIGTFNWSVSASPTTVNAGDPVTLKIAVSGHGNLDNLKLPDLNWPDFKAYPASSSVALDDALGIQGTKTFEQVVIPQSISVKEVPSFSLSYFDPETKSYVKLTQPAIPVTVSAGPAGTAQPLVLAPKGPQPDEPQERTDIVHIKTNPGPLVAFAPPLVQQPWFLSLQALPVLAWVGLKIWRRKQDVLANNPKLRRKIAVQETIANGLAELEQRAANGNNEAFYALMFRLLQEQLGERLDLPASAITEAVLAERLPNRGASKELLERLHHLFQACNQARYAPVGTHEQLKALQTELHESMDELQRLPDTTE